MATGYFIAFGAGSFAQGQYYEGDKEHWKDADVPRCPEKFSTWNPNPDRATYADWKFDGHDADGGSWNTPQEQTPAQ